jgi:hypothetical protein
MPIFSQYWARDWQVSISAGAPRMAGVNVIMPLYNGIIAIGEFKSIKRDLSVIEISRICQEKAPSLSEGRGFFHLRMIDR